MFWITSDSFMVTDSMKSWLQHQHSLLSSSLWTFYHFLQRLDGISTVFQLSTLEYWHSIPYPIHLWIQYIHCQQNPNLQTPLAFWIFSVLFVVLVTCASNPQLIHFHQIIELKNYPSLCVVAVIIHGVCKPLCICITWFEYQVYICVVPHGASNSFIFLFPLLFCKGQIANLGQLSKFIHNFTHFHQ